MEDESVIKKPYIDYSEGEHRATQGESDSPGLPKPVDVDFSEQGLPTTAAAHSSPDGSATGNNLGNNAINGCDLNKKKKHRRGKNKGGKKHHKKWKPYDKLTWDERKKLDERESLRACAKRERRFASGHPVAPYNTTQFLMEQYHPITPDLDRSDDRTNRSKGDGSGSLDSGSEDNYYDSPNDDEDIFLEREFTQAYEDYHAERLQTMSKEELIRDYLELEGRVEILEKRKNSMELNGINLSGDADEAVTLKQEMAKLRQENQRLKQENRQLREQELHSTESEK